MTVRPTMVTWYSFGQVQRIIKQRYREGSRPGNIPTFREFVKYLVTTFLLIEESVCMLIMKKMPKNREKRLLLITLIKELFEICDVKDHPRNF